VGVGSGAFDQVTGLRLGRAYLLNRTFRFYDLGFYAYSPQKTRLLGLSSAPTRAKLFASACIDALGVLAQVSENAVAMKQGVVYLFSTATAKELPFLWHNGVSQRGNRLSRAHLSVLVDL